MDLFNPHSNPRETSSNIHILEIRKPSHRESQRVAQDFPACQNHGRVVLESMFFSMRLLDLFPDTQLVRAGPRQVFTGINTSAKCTKGIPDLAVLSCSPVSWFEV